jgi:ribonuclease R
MQTLVLQSLKRAEYSTEDIGHFGLQIEQYAHFTSPIRRYPDLIVHRLIKDKLCQRKMMLNKDHYEVECFELSVLERQAEKISRTVIQQIICHHLKQFIGDSFKAVISGVTDFGIFAEIDNFYVSGLVHVSDLPGDRYMFDKISGILKGKRTVNIDNVLPYERKINLTIVKT